jgi:hypothetical protein
VSTMAFDLGTTLQRELASLSTPSRRSNKNHSGRSLRKSANGAEWLARVGGRSSDTAAIYAPADAHLCVVVPATVGWNADGTPRREPRW